MKVMRRMAIQSQLRSRRYCTRWMRHVPRDSIAGYDELLFILTGVSTEDVGAVIRRYEGRMRQGKDTQMALKQSCGDLKG